MAVVVFLLVLQLTGQVFSQCFTSTDCTGSQVTAVDQQTCCVETSDGLSYNDGSTCNICIGSGSDILNAIIHCSEFLPVHGFLQREYSVQEDDRLDTSFQLNVKGRSQFSSILVISGTITAEAQGTASKKVISFLLVF